MAARVTDAVVPLSSGHLPHVTMPEAIAAVCDGAAALCDDAAAAVTGQPGPPG